ncbi:hypothetical protein CANCADRAFT_101319 [Tortispora caseinolytica NRRL Y-17796]|uniref:Maf-like protein n=1 Tax=Tortispora caseinolytica NRRL Y-17796 TaxID=767744 RepID=A0A1E4TEG1_9ASCO|nr:hypothetical protein CANCADRAFT_101319 [Tortispora caseinolytica NRRL Y-17796]
MLSFFGSAGSSKQPSPPPKYSKVPGNERILDLPIFKRLSDTRVVLASSSPRRLELMKQIGFEDIEVVPSDFEEDLDKSSMSPFEYVRLTATEKAQRVYQKILEEQAQGGDERDVVVIAGDTIVLAAQTVLEKPTSSAHQLEMLKLIRDSPLPHSVFTAVVCIAPTEVPVQPGYVMNTHVEQTDIVFDKEVSDEFLEAYIYTGEGRDAAGGYSIQGRGSLFIERMDGDYFNVVGLPLRATLKLIEKTVLEDAMYHEPESDEGDEKE